MSQVGGALSIDSAAESILSAIESEPEAGTEAPIENLSDEAKADRIANEAEPEVKAEGEVTEAKEPEVEAHVEPIEPPASWNADAKERFKALPPELQTYVRERESERDRGLSKTQQEAAEARKAVEAERSAVQAERQQLAQRLSNQIDYLETMDPVIADGRKTDWAKAAQDDPINVQAKWFAWQQREMQLAQLSQQRDQARQRMMSDEVRKANEALSTKLDFWKDTDKRSAFQSDLKKHLVAEGYQPQEIEGITDARAILTARKAMLYDKMMAEQATIEAKRKATPAPKTVLKSQSSSDPDKSDKAVAALKRVKSLSRTDDQAALIASLLE